MSNELNKRIITSVLLLFASIFSVLNKPTFVIAIFIISAIAFSEINKMIYRITKSTNNKKWILFNFIALVYIFFIFIPSSFALHLLNPVLILYFLFICICSDVGGYIIGKTIGGKKLTKISPNKTISGSIGSFCFSILPLLVFNIFNQSEYYLSISNFLICLLISLVSQLGDLFISFIKRKAKVKDSGKILPGHGGLLDRIDGIIFVIPFAQLYLTGLNGYIEMWTYVISK